MQLQAMVFAKDLGHLVSFYSLLLGTDTIVETRDVGWAELVVGSTVLTLHAIPPHIAADIEITRPPHIREDTAIKLVVTLDRPALDEAALRTLGGLVIHRPWGGIDVVDPEGNVVGVVLSEPD